MNKNIIDDTGDFLPIMEVFLSIQGEGHFTGTASYFIRIGGCDVGCHWCDVKESWNPEIHPLINVDSIVKKIPKHIKTVILTGGEPTLYNLSKLINLLKEKNIQVHLETSGTGYFTEKVDWICLSPKKNELPKKDFYKKANELKIIIQNKTDFIFAEEQFTKINNKALLYLQPEWSQRNKMTPLIIDYVQKHPKWKISLQTHKYLNIP